MATPFFVPGALPFNVGKSAGLVQKGEYGNAIGALLGFDPTPGGNITRPVASTAPQATAKKTSVKLTDNFNPGDGSSIFGGSGSGGATSSAQTTDPQAVAYYNDQINSANSALARLTNQRAIGQANIEDAFNESRGALENSNQIALRDYGIKKQNTIDDNVEARAGVDRNVSRQSAGLKRLLGNSSSAALFAAPLAVARQGTEQAAGIGKSFDRNLTSLLNADSDRENNYKASQAELNRKKQQSINDLEAGLADTEAKINDSLQGLAIQKSQAAGQNYSQARAGAQAYSTRVSDLLNRIDTLGRNPSITAQNIAFTAPNLEGYTADTIGVSQNAQNALPGAGIYSNLIGMQDDRKKLLG